MSRNIVRFIYLAFSVFCSLNVFADVPKLSTKEDLLNYINSPATSVIKAISYSNSHLSLISPESQNALIAKSTSYIESPGTTPQQALAFFKQAESNQTVREAIIQTTLRKLESYIESPGTTPQQALAFFKLAESNKTVREAIIQTTLRKLESYIESPGTTPQQALAFFKLAESNKTVREAIIQTTLRKLENYITSPGTTPQQALAFFKLAESNKTVREAIIQTTLRKLENYITSPSTTAPEALNLLSEISNTDDYELYQANLHLVKTKCGAANCLNLPFPASPSPMKK
jgi:pyrroline-5-carboxylate reductase